jgi:N utilization substance protein B
VFQAQPVHRTGKGFSLRLLEEVIDNHLIIDKLIEKCAPEWPLDQVTVIDRNVLRLGIFELLYGNYDEAEARSISVWKPRAY